MSAPSTRSQISRGLGVLVALAIPGAVLAALVDHLDQSYRGQPPEPHLALIGMVACLPAAWLDRSSVPMATVVALAGLTAVGAQVAYLAGHDTRWPLDATCLTLPLFCLAVTAMLFRRARREGSWLRGIAVGPLLPLWAIQIVFHVAMAHTRGGSPLLGVVGPIGWILVPWLSLAVLLDAAGSARHP